MRRIIIILLGMFLIHNAVHAKGPSTKREELFFNKKVRVWKTFIYPSAKHALPMHRHEHDRVVIALTDGVIKIINNHGKTHIRTLKKDQAYYLPKDVPNEWHKDINMSKHEIKVVVVELND